MAGVTSVQHACLDHVTTLTRVASGPLFTLKLQHVGNKVQYTLFPAYLRTLISRLSPLCPQRSCQASFFGFPLTRKTGSQQARSDSRFSHLLFHLTEIIFGRFSSSLTFPLPQNNSWWNYPKTSSLHCVFLHSTDLHSTLPFLISPLKQKLCQTVLPCVPRGPNWAW